MKHFKKYSHIENSYQKEYIERVKEIVPADMLWSVSEKVDGSNFSFVTNGKEVRCGKRSGLIDQNEKFYRYELVVAKYQQRVYDLFELMKKDIPELQQVEFFGELYGGVYPDMKGDGAVQNRIKYNPEQDFYGFDIMAFINDEAVWFGPDDVEKYYKAGGFFYNEELFRGTLEEALKYPNDFISTISGRLGLPPVDENIAEGVVIKPIIPQFFGNGDRIIIKNKNEKFKEKMDKVKSTSSVPLTPEVQEEIDQILAYVTMNRLINVESHLGSITFPADMGKIIKEFTADVMEDYLKERKVKWDALEKKDQKVVTSRMTKEAANIIKKKHIEGL